MRLARYLNRIGYSGSQKPTFETLKAITRAHVLAVPFEDLDVQLGRPLNTDVEAAYDKIVERRRGGWCYEMNGVMGWALAEMGFDVMRMGAGVRRDLQGDFAFGNHLCLRVECEGTWLVDVGFGGSLTGPFPLGEHARKESPYNVALTPTDDGCWRFSEDAGEGPFTFDFRPEAADETLLDKRCQYLQSDPKSPFVQTLVAQRRRPKEHVILRGRTLTIVGDGGKATSLLQSADEMMDVLVSVFGLDEPGMRTLWPRICERHEALFAENANAAAG